MILSAIAAKLKQRTKADFRGRHFGACRKRSPPEKIISGQHVTTPAHPLRQGTWIGLTGPKSTHTTGVRPRREDNFLRQKSLRQALGASIPMTKALGPEALLAYAMNGEPLEAEHGAPLRVVVPGYAGVRSPKWVHTITVQDRLSDNLMQADDYKLCPPHVTKATSDPRRGMTINAMPMNSAICEPAPHARLRAGPAQVRGYAMASDRSIVRVDVSGDCGRTWQQPELDETSGAPWAWTFWTATIDLPPGEHELAVRAWDAAGQTQPALSDDTWNFKGYLSAAWHLISVIVA